MGCRKLVPAVVFLGAALLAGSALADVIYLKSGKQMEGLAEERDDTVVLRLERGSMTFAKADVERIEKCPPPWEVYEARARLVKPDDVAAHLALAKWCRSQNLSLRMQKELEIVVRLQPDHREARELLGHRQVDGRWLTPEEYFALQRDKPPTAAPAPTPTPVPAPVPAPGLGPASGPRNIPDGSYTGASRGYVDDVSVRVTVGGGRIAAVNVAGHRENRARTSLQDVPPRIVQRQNTQVDATTGATVTSKAVMRAAQNALCSSAPIRISDVPDGSYTGVSRGQRSDITAQVTVQGGRITDVRVLSSSEPPKNAQCPVALATIPRQIVQQQSTAVPPVAGAELTSRGVMRAVQAALDSAVARVLPGK